MLTKRFILFGALAALAGCTLDNQAPPSLSGPSELGLSLAVTASPDVIKQDGLSQATVDIVAKDANNQPVRGLALQVETMVGNVAVDFGQLSSKSVSTGNDGKATVTYRAPAEPPASVSSDTVVTVAVTPVGTNYAQSVSRVVNIRLTRPGVILPPNGAPKPDFFFSPTQPREEDDVLFDGSASTDPDGQIVSYVWNFGDGGTGSGVRLTHSYGLAGTYNVILTVTDDRGISVPTAPKQVQVGSTAVPTADFTFSPTTPIVNQTVNFNGSPSTASAARDIVAYDWDFGDGSPHGSGVTPQHAYAVQGTYTVVLKVTDNTGRSGVASKSLAVGVAAPKADFTISPPTATANVTVVQFNGNLSTAPPGRTIASFAWDFGDGVGASASAPSHVYTASGTYTVVLTVTDNTGQIGVTSKTITVSP